VKQLHVGQLVVPLIRDPGVTGQESWQEYIVIPASGAVPVPDALCDETALQFLIDSWTGYKSFILPVNFLAKAACKA